MDTEPIDPAASRPQVVGGRFVVERLLARGGMGAVYLARQRNLGRPVALKIMTPPPDAEATASFAERFRLEAETLAGLHHPHIVTVYDYGPTEDGRYYLAMEYVDGPRLTDLIRGGRLQPGRLVDLVLQVCQALAYAHRRGVVHRDLKPGNLLVRQEDGAELVKVVDFGLVKVLEADQALTRAGLVLGSPHCMAPEQVRGEEVDPRADLYAVGVLLFRCLTGVWPFHGDSVAATMVAHLHRPVPSFAAVAPDLVVPPGLEAVVARCLAKAPAERFPDAAALAQALAACRGPVAEGPSTTAALPAVGEAATREAAARDTAARGTAARPRRLGLWVGAALLVLAGLGALGLWRAGLAPSPPAATPAAPPSAATAEAPAAPPTAAALPDPAAPDPAEGVPAVLVPASAPGPRAGAPPAAAAPAPAGEETAPAGYMPLPDDLQ